MYTITLSENDLAVVGKALAELPFRISAPVIQTIEKQLHSSQSSATMAESCHSPNS